LAPLIDIKPFVQMLYILFELSTPQVKYILFDLTIENIEKFGVIYVTGGLQGFGLRTAQWLADKGARHLILIVKILLKKIYYHLE